MTTVDTVDTDMQVATNYNIIQRYKREQDMALVQTLKYYEGLKEKRLYVFKRIITNGIGIEDNIYHYLVIKNKWWRYEHWSDDRIPSCDNEMGTTIVEEIYQFMEKQNDLTSRLVIFIITENLFYIAPFRDIKDFVKKKSSYHTDDNGKSVIGLSADLFTCNKHAFK